MNPHQPASFYPSPQMHESLPDSMQQGSVDVDTPNDWPSNSQSTNLHLLNDFYYCSSEPTTSAWSPWSPLNQTFAIPAGQVYSPVQTFTAPNEANHIFAAGISERLIHANPQDLANVPQWLDGAYRPPVPCSHCRRYRMQCLIIRTTTANPNPEKSCSSCVALFRECSLSRGEKRLPSGFETFSPVLGHLHGLPEHAEDSVGDHAQNKNMRCDAQG